MAETKINLADSRGRDAEVLAGSVSIAMEYRWVDESGAQADSCKILRATMPRDFGALTAEFGDEDDALADALVAGDPEVDFELYGSFLEDVSRVYVDPDKEIVHKIALYEIVRTPDGEEKEKRQRKSAEPNVSTEIPVQWTGKKFKKPEVYNRFVFGLKMQISHVNGLTYDFLYTMAKELEDDDCLMLLAGGSKGNQPLVFRRNGVAYRGFLEGRTDDKKYALILHLTNMELKKPETSE
ncbi:MAG: hypothetical protein ACI8UO_001414 [Verrucomicrobiales bacterium]|jgi:hypothetical protein